MHNAKTRWETFTENWRYGVASVTVLVWIAFFVGAHRFVGNSIAAFSILPAIVIAGLFGVRIGILFAVLLIPLDTLLFNVIGETGWDVVYRVGGLPGAGAVIIVASISGYLRDILLERNSLLERVTNTSEELTMLLGALPDTMFRLAANSRIIDYRAGVNADVVLDREHLTNKSYYDTLPRHLAVEVGNIHQRVMLTQQPENFECEFHFPHEDNPRWLEARFVALPNEETLVIIRDITQDRAIAEGRILHEVQRERIDFLRDFIGSVSHDFRTPLSIIRNNMYLLRRLKDRPEKFEEKVSQVEEQTQRLEQIVNDILIISRLDSDLDASYQRVNIGRNVNSAVSNVRHIAQERDILIIVKNEYPDLTVLGNDLSLHQAFSALVMNAIKFSESADEIQVTITRNEHNHASVTIKDEGVGISENDLPNIYNHFYRADKSRSQHTGGTGLGLTIAKRIINLHRGEITIESELGVGTTVTVTLPSIEEIAPQVTTEDYPQIPDSTLSG